MVYMSSSFGTVMLGLTLIGFGVLLSLMIVCCWLFSVVMMMLVASCCLVFLLMVIDVLLVVCLIVDNWNLLWKCMFSVVRFLVVSVGSGLCRWCSGCFLRLVRVIVCLVFVSDVVVLILISLVFIMSICFGLLVSCWVSGVSLFGVVLMCVLFRLGSGGGL